jgi:hypothetical protein
VCSVGGRSVSFPSCLMPWRRSQTSETERVGPAEETSCRGQHALCRAGAVVAEHSESQPPWQMEIETNMLRQRRATRRFKAPYELLRYCPAECQSTGKRPYMPKKPKILSVEIIARHATPPSPCSPDPDVASLAFRFPHQGTSYRARMDTFPFITPTHPTSLALASLPGH